MGLGVVVAVYGAIEAAQNYVCPDCGASLDRSGVFSVPEYCPKCGRKL